jgi:hypothetical protein
MDAVELPSLPEMRARWRTLAIVHAACDLPDFWASSVESDTYADPIGSGLELLVLRSQAAVLTGFDAELDDEEAWADPDLLTEGAPAWVRSAVEEVAPLGDAVWWDGSGWWRSSAAAGIPRSIEVLATPVLSVDGLVDEILLLLDADDPSADDRELARRVAERPTVDALVALFTGRRFGFDAEQARAAVADPLVDGR